MLPSLVMELSMLMPRSRPMERMALPAILLISPCRNELRAEFIENDDVLPSVRYMPEASIVTAIFPRPSSLMVFSSSWIDMSLGASMRNSIPGDDSVFDSFTPQVKSTTRPMPVPSFTVAFTASVAVMFSVGSMGSPVNSM